MPPRSRQYPHSVRDPSPWCGRWTTDLLSCPVEDRDGNGRGPVTEGRTPIGLRSDRRRRTRDSGLTERTSMDGRSFDPGKRSKSKLSNLLTGCSVPGKTGVIPPLPRHGLSPLLQMVPSFPSTVLCLLGVELATSLS